ncbi:hypothetical protein BDA96_10G231600 [Sorghum bicolor]|uniref:Uncharacterized protein n=1 Tax=Sorghum bicolor TaxID=4558 RepID=A0A921Q5U1_SORBI|nr:hypothetical protein BDA96_10G231600 [Sorghum bicolor]
MDPTQPQPKVSTGPSPTIGLGGSLSSTRYRRPPLHGVPPAPHPPPPPPLLAADSRDQATEPMAGRRHRPPPPQPTSASGVGTVTNPHCRIPPLSVSGKLMLQKGHLRSPAMLRARPIHPLSCLAQIFGQISWNVCFTKLWLYLAHQVTSLPPSHLH